MYGLDKIIAGIALALTALTGLFISANAADAAFTLFGYLLFVFSILMAFRFVALMTSKGETQP